MLNYTLAKTEDWQSIICLLEINDLPFSDIQENLTDFIVTKIDNEVVGCIGIEKYGTDALLRSFAVRIDLRSRGIGKELFNRFLIYAIQKQINNIHLLTETAKGYFSKIGFSIENRCNASKTISSTSEFAYICPSTSVYMILEDISNHVK